MPEGDTIYRAARTLNTALAGQVVERFETGLAQLAQIDRDEPIVGRRIESVEAAGKNLLMTLSPHPNAQTPRVGAPAGGLVLRTHLRMNGSWHIYRPGEKWQMSPRAMRIVIATSEWVAVAFNVYVAEFVRSEDTPPRKGRAAGIPPDRMSRHRPIAMLGPDLLGDFDAAEALARVRRQGARPIHEVLLDQRVMAGIGNVYKSELLFLRNVHPDTRADALSDAEWAALMELAVKLLRDNVSESSGPGIETYRGLRRTTGHMRPEDRLWVYSRGGRPCRKCATPIASRKDGDDARVTYWCPSCQAPAR